MQSWKRRVSWCIGVAAIALAPFFGAVSDAGASLPTVTAYCGMRITSSIRIGNDLSCAGLAIQTDRIFSYDPITIDLGGHTIASTSTDPFSPVFWQADPGLPGAIFSWTMVRNGRLKGPAGASLGSGDVYFTNVVFDGGGITTGGGYGGRVTIKHSTFIHGAHISADQETVISTNNRFIGDGSYPTAINLLSSQTTVKTTAISGYETGIATSGVGQYPPGNQSVDLEQNRITGNGTGIRIAYALQVRGTLAKNIVTANREDGIVISFGSNLTLTSNIASTNGHDGILVDGEPTPDTGTQYSIILTLTGNRATLNADWGIEDFFSQPPEVIITDGGGNIAHQNNTGQCFYLACA